MINASSNHQRLTASSIGDGVSLACQSTIRPGVVVGNFISGFYIRIDEKLFAVGGPGVPAGPIHLLLDKFPPPCVEHSLVEFETEQLRFDSFSIDLTQANRHRPNQPTPIQLQKIAPILARLESWHAKLFDLAPVWTKVKYSLETADLHGARQILAGLGSGLTPTGDDVLAGLLLFAHWADPQSRLPGDIAEQSATSDLSRCFLNWSAKGQSIQPLHDLIDAATAMLLSSGEMASDMTVNTQFAQSVAAVVSIGDSSGKGLLAGLGLAATVGSNRR